jgi:hypothetical protein
MFVDSPLTRVKDIDTLYMDNTYFHPNFASMPTREQAREKIIDVIEAHRGPSDSTLFQVDLKILGKEDLLIDLAQHFHTRILVSELRYIRNTQVLDLDERHFVSARRQPLPSGVFIFVEDQNDPSDNHFFLNFVRNHKIIHILPTALPLDQKQRRSYFQIAYSDHSSYNEIVEFVRHLRPKRVLPIVHDRLPNNLDTTNMSVLKPFLSTKAPVDCYNKYKCLLASSTSVRASAMLRNHSLRSNNKRKLPSGANLPQPKRPTRRQPTRIEYDCKTPEKENTEESVTMNVLSRKINMVKSLGSSSSNSPHRLVSTQRATPKRTTDRSHLETIREENIPTTSASASTSTGLTTGRDEGGCDRPDKWYRINDLVEISVPETESPTPSPRSQSKSSETTKTVELIKSNDLNPVVRLQKINMSSYIASQEKRKTRDDAIKSMMSGKFESDDQTGDSEDDIIVVGVIPALVEQQSSPVRKTAAPTAASRESTVSEAATESSNKADAKSLVANKHAATESSKPDNSKSALNQALVIK